MPGSLKATERAERAVPPCFVQREIQQLCAEFHVALLEGMEVQTELIKTHWHQAWEEGADGVGFFLLCSCFFSNSEAALRT